MNKKKFAKIAAVSVAVLLGLVLLSNPFRNLMTVSRYGSGGCFNADGSYAVCAICYTFGRVTTNSFGTSCEMRASDAGKRCTYDSECALSCVYKNQAAEAGRCDAYSNDNNNRYPYCHRPVDRIICGSDIIS